MQGTGHLGKHKNGSERRGLYITERDVPPLLPPQAPPVTTQKQRQSKQREGDRHQKVARGACRRGKAKERTGPGGGR